MPDRSEVKVQLIDSKQFVTPKNKNTPTHSPMSRGVPITASPADPSAVGAGGFLGDRTSLPRSQLQPWLVPQLWHR